MGLKKKFNNKVIFFYYLLLITSCKYKHKEHTISAYNPLLLKIESTQVKDSIKTAENNTEYISIDSILIKNKYPYKGKREFLNEIIKKNDSINKFGYECGSELEENNEIFYSEGFEVEVSNKFYVFRKINFVTSKVYLNYKNIVFNSNYSIEDFSTDFPKSFKRNKTVDGNEIEIILSSIPSDTFDISWKLIFLNGHLKSLYYFIPC